MTQVMMKGMRQEAEQYQVIWSSKSNKKGFKAQSKHGLQTSVTTIEVKTEAVIEPSSYAEAIAVDSSWQCACYRTPVGVSKEDQC